MSLPLRSWRTVGVGACCAAAGIGGGAIATAGASSNTHAKANHGTAAKHAHGRHAHGLARVARRSVHGDAVIHTKDGYKTVSWDRGAVTKVDGDQITLAEGTAKAPYKSVTITVPASAHVRDDGQKAAISSVKTGQRAVIAQLPKRTVVIARTPKHRSA